ncbi:MAG: hypothetical protein NT031_02570 [Planctomycetota bacterium]|nr:hypothetical protein [Planctomycetota bacterium]
MIGFKAHDGLDLVRAGLLGDGGHHHHGPDGEHRGRPLLLIGQQLTQRGRDKPLLAQRAVFGRHEHLAAEHGQVVLQDHVRGRPPPDERNDLVAGLGQGLRQRIQHGRAHAPADADDSPELLDLRVLAQGAGHIPQRAADGDIDDLLRAGLGVGLGDGQGDSLAALGAADNDELARLAGLRDPRGLDDQTIDVLSKDLVLEDLEHRVILRAGRG